MHFLTILWKILLYNFIKWGAGGVSRAVYTLYKKLEFEDFGLLAGRVKMCRTQWKVLGASPHRKEMNFRKVPIGP